MSTEENERFTFYVDGVPVEAEPGWTVARAAAEAGIYVPRLCHTPKLEPWGSCRVCTVRANGKACASCTQPAAEGLVVEVDTAELREMRRTIVEMLFVDGNHFCMSCEKSGNCELQAFAYRLGIEAPQLPYLQRPRDVDASHPEILIDHNRCILCGRCVRASRDLDGKAVFGFVDRGTHRRVAVNSAARLVDSEIDVADEAVGVCPVGALLRKGVGFRVPIGSRLYDHEPIGSEIEGR